MGPAEFKEEADYYLALMNYLCASMKLTLHLHERSSELLVISTRMANLERDILAAEQTGLGEFLTGYKSVSGGWLDDYEEIADIHQRIKIAEEQIADLSEQITLMQDTFDDEGNYESTKPVFPVIKAELEKIAQGDDKMYRDNWYRLTTALAVFIKADKITMTEACRPEAFDMPALVVNSYLIWLRDIGLLLYDAEEKTFQLTENGLKFIKELPGRINELPPGKI